MLPDDPAIGFTPKGWAHCNGQLLQISQNQALFALLGTTYGGNGQTTFALPDLRARVPMQRGPIHGAQTSGSGFGISGGERAHTLTASEMPMHAHALSVTNSSGTAPQPSGRVLAASNNMYASPGGNATTLDPQTPRAVGPVAWTRRPSSARCADRRRPAALLREPARCADGQPVGRPQANSRISLMNGEGIWLQSTVARRRFCHDEVIS